MQMNHPTSTPAQMATNTYTVYAQTRAPNPELIGRYEVPTHGAPSADARELSVKDQRRLAVYKAVHDPETRIPSVDKDGYVSECNEGRVFFVEDSASVDPETNYVEFEDNPTFKALLQNFEQSAPETVELRADEYETFKSKLDGLFDSMYGNGYNEQIDRLDDLRAAMEIDEEVGE